MARKASEVGCGCLHSAVSESSVQRARCECVCVVCTSNLLPVNANVLVRFLSVGTRWRLGRDDTPSWIAESKSGLLLSPAMKRSTDWSMSSPRYTLTMAGGASFAPSRWSLPTPLMATLIRSACLSIARMVAARNSMNSALPSGLSPGLSREGNALLPTLQLLCLPLPLTPLNGFSCSRAASPCLRAVLWRVSINTKLRSVPTCTRQHSSSSSSSQ